MPRRKALSIAAEIAKTIEGADEVFVAGMLMFIVSDEGRLREVLLVRGGYLARGDGSKVRSWRKQRRRSKPHVRTL